MVFSCSNILLVCTLISAAKAWSVATMGVVPFLTVNGLDANVANSSKS